MRPGIAREQQVVQALSHVCVMRMPDQPVPHHLRCDREPSALLEGRASFLQGHSIFYRQALLPCAGCSLREDSLPVS
jgi:hypothetical protein